VVLIVVLDALLGTFIMTHFDPIGFAQRYPLPVMLVTGGMIVGMYSMKGRGLAWIKSQFKK